MGPETTRLLFYIKEILILYRDFFLWFQLIGVYFYLLQILTNDYLNMRIISKLKYSGPPNEIIQDIMMTILKYIC